MKSRFVLRLGVVSLGLALFAACGPAPTEGFSFEGIDAATLQSSLIAIGTSREQTSLAPMKGSFILVDQKGKARHLDHSGMDALEVAFDGKVVAFSDTKHDYLLGSEHPVRSRKKAASIFTGIGLHEGSLVSIFNLGTAETGYEMQISHALAGETDASLKLIKGWFESVTQCDNGVWVLMRENLDWHKPMTLKRLFPDGGSDYIVDAGREESVDEGDYYWDATTCEDNVFVAIGGRSYDESPDQPHILQTNLETGVTTITKVSGFKEDMNPWNVSVNGKDITVLLKENWEQELHELWSIDPVTGEAVLVKTIQTEFKPALTDQLYEFVGPYLYQLDVTFDEPSYLRAYDAETGELFKEKKLPALYNLVNSENTLSEALESFKDFVVLTPADQW